MGTYAEDHERWEQRVKADQATPGRVATDPIVQGYVTIIDRKDAELVAYSGALEEAHSAALVAQFEHQSALAERDMLIADLRSRVARAERLMNAVRNCPYALDEAGGWWNNVITPILAEWPTNRA